MQKIFIDLDGVVFDTIAKIVDLYNTDYVYYKDFKVVLPSDIKTWDFNELTLETKENIDKYFNQPRFFMDLPLMKSAKWIINKLHNNLGFKIIFCSSGSYPNLQLKKIWIEKYFSYADFIPVEMSMYADKSHIDMADSYLIDDCSKNLYTSNAKNKICFGDIYPWNEDWNGIRVNNWVELFGYIRKEGINNGQ